MFTTAKAAEHGLSRKQLGRLKDAGVLEHLMHGVYRMEGAPRHAHETALATVLALEGHRPGPYGAPQVVAAGETAAIIHDLGDFLPDGLELILSTHKQARRAGVRVRRRDLQRSDIRFIDSIPVLGVEAMIADLVELESDTSLVGRVVEQAHRTGQIASARRLEDKLSPYAQWFGHQPMDGRSLRQELYEIAGINAEARRVLVKA